MATGHAMKMSVPMTASASTGTLSSTFKIAWASNAPPSGYVYDIEIRRPGYTTYTYWKHGTTAVSATFKPDHGRGTYTFLMRLRRVSVNRTSGWSAPLFLKIS
jgi:hypothetical protein